MRRQSRARQLPVILGSVLLAACGAHAAADQAKVERGRQVYMNARCFACHGQYGFGGTGPRFRENRFLALQDYVVGQILVGRGVMPSFAHALKDDDIAAVASYIRTSWGNNFGAVDPKLVGQLRQQVELHPPAGRPTLPPLTKEPFDSFQYRPDQDAAPQPSR